MIMRLTYTYMKAIMAAVLLSVSGLVLNAQTLPSLLLVQDPVSVSTGMSGVVADGSAFSLQNNVAAMSISDSRADIRAGVGLWQPSYAGIKAVGAGGFMRFGKLGVGLDLEMLMMPAYGGVSDNGAALRDSEFSPSETNFAAGVSYAFMDYLSAGLTLRYAGSKLAADASAAVFGADLALYFKKDGITAGLSVNNIGTKVKYSDTAYPQPMMARVGAGYELGLSSSSLAISAEADVLFAGGVMAGAGCEYAFKDMIFARVGYHYGNSANVIPSYASAGLGLKLFGLHLDVAYMFASEVLSNSMIVSLGYSF